MAKPSLLKNIVATILPQTLELLMYYTDTMNLTYGEVIDRAVLQIATKRPDLAAQFIFDQFCMAVCPMEADDANYAIILAIGYLCVPLLLSGMSTDELSDAVMEVVEERLSKLDLDEE